MIAVEVEFRLAWNLYQRHVPNEVKEEIEYTLFTRLRIDR